MTETDTTTPLGELIDRYLAAWNEPDPARRAALIEQVWAADGRLIDPPLAAEGHAGIGDMAAALQTQFPGHRFRRASGIDAHHDQLRFAWQLGGPRRARHAQPDPAARRRHGLAARLPPRRDRPGARPGRPRLAPPAPLAARRRARRRAPGDPGVDPLHRHPATSHPAPQVARGL